MGKDGAVADRGTGRGDRGSDAAGRSNSRDRRAIRIARRRPRAASDARLPARRADLHRAHLGRPPAAAVGGYNGFWLDPGDKVIAHRRRSRAARSSSIRRWPRAGADAGRPRSGWRPRPPTRRSRAASSIIPSCARSAERCLMSFGSNAGPADAAELLLQQQLHDRADARTT